jgi:xylose isomerase
VRRYALRKILRNLDLAADLEARTFVLWAVAKARRVTPARTSALLWIGTGTGLDRLPSTWPTRATVCASRSNRNRTSRGATSCCRQSGHALAFIVMLEHREMAGDNPEVGHEQMAGLNFAHGIAQALWHGKLFHIDLNGQTGPRFDQDLIFGHGDLLNAFALVDLLENGGPGGGPAYDGPRHFDYKPLRTEDRDGVWTSAAANMETYLLLKERAAEFRADPAVQDALDASRVAELAVPTLSDTESYADLLRDRSAFEDFDPDAVGQPG